MHKTEKRLHNRSGVRWTSAEIRTLKHALKSGLPLDCIDITGRSFFSIRAKAYELGYSTGTRWTQKEVSHLKQVWERDVPLSNIVIESPLTGEIRSAYSIRVKAVRLGLKERRTPRASWVQSEIELLRKLHKAGLKARDIKMRGHFGSNRTTCDGRVLPERNVNAIAKMMQRMGFVDKERSECTSRGRLNLSASDGRRLDSFIRKHYKEMTSQEIANYFGVSSGTVRRRRHALFPRFSFRKAVRLPGSKMQDPQFADERSERVKKAWATRRNRDTP